MLKTAISLYVGAEKENGYSGYLGENNWFLIMELEDGVNSEKGRSLFQQIKSDLVKRQIDSLAEFDHLLAGTIKEHNLPSDLSLAAGYLNTNVLYLKTVGSGSVFLQRRGKFARLIAGNQFASGFIEAEDILVFTTSHFVEKIGGENEIRKSLHHRDIHQIIEEMTPKIKSNDDQGLIALFSRFTQPSETVTLPKADDMQIDQEASINEPLFISRTNPFEKLMNNINLLYERTQQSIGEAGKKKTFTFIAVIILFLIFIYSVGLGYVRRSDANTRKKIASVKESVQQKLNQADDAAFFNLTRSNELISDAKKELALLKKEVPASKKQELQEIASLITQKENKILKKEERSYEEFYDLQVDSKQASGTKLFLDGEYLLILDSGQGTIYMLQTTKKSLDKNTFAEVKSATLVAGYQQDKFFMSGNGGFYKISGDEKPKKIIDKDTDWKSITDVWIYNGNIYLLDKGNEIYKYLVAENGYSNKTSYFQEGQAANLQQANSLAIDSSLYIGLDNKILKYTAGVQDEFKTSFPSQEAAIHKVFTNKDLEKVYVWDKQKGSVYILGKDGTYEREVNSSVLRQANDLVVQNNKAYILSGPKIYTVDLE